MNSDLIEGLKRFGVVKRDESLKNYTTFRTGGPAEVLFTPSGSENISGAVALIREFSAPLTVIGGGSNLLVSDRGVSGVVMRICDDAFRGGITPDKKNEEIVRVDAAVRKEDFVEFVMENGYEGAEFMAGLPGCMGGGIAMNAGTDIGTFANVLESVKFINGRGEVATKKITGDMVGYRRLLVDGIEGDPVYLSGVFRLAMSGEGESIRRVVNEILEERRNKHPLDFPSAGSVFKNPPGNQSWKLVDDAGLKGARVGGAMVSELHTNFIINVDNATSSDIASLIGLVRETILKKFQVCLEAEVRMVGEFEL